MFLMRLQQSEYTNCREEFEIKVFSRPLGTFSKFREHVLIYSSKGQINSKSPSGVINLIKVPAKFF